MATGARGSQVLYIVDRQDESRWREAGDLRAAAPDEAVQRLATGPGLYRVRPEGAAPETARLYRVQLSGRAVEVLG